MMNHTLFLNAYGHILTKLLYLSRMFSVSDWFWLAIFCWVARKWKMLINPWMNLGEPSGWSLDDKSLGTLSYQLDWFLLRLLILGNAWRDRPRQFDCNRFKKCNVSKMEPEDWNLLKDIVWYAKLMFNVLLILTLTNKFNMLLIEK